MRCRRRWSFPYGRGLVLSLLPIVTPSRERKRAPFLLLLTFAIVAVSSCTLTPKDEGPFLDPQFGNLIPADTTFLLGVSVERLVKTAVYQKYLTGLPIPAIEQFGARTGIDPEKKLWQILYVSNGKTGYWLGRGKFAEDFMAPDYRQPGIQRFTYNGYTLFGNEQKAMVVFNASTAAIGETAVMRHLVDQSLVTTAPPAKITALRKQLPYEVQAWAVWLGGKVDLALPGNLSNATRVLQSMDTATMDLDLTTNVKGTISGTAVSDAAAQDVQGAFASLLALSQSVPKTQSLLRGIVVNREGTKVSIHLDAPPELLGLLLR